MVISFLKPFVPKPYEALNSESQCFFLFVETHHNLVGTHTHRQTYNQNQKSSHITVQSKESMSENGNVTSELHYYYTVACLV